MAIDWDGLLYGPAMAVLGVPATLTLNDTASTSVDLTVHNDTGGVTVGYNEVGVATIRPAASVRAVELAEKGVAVADLDGASLTMSGKTWTVISHAYVVAPTGEAQGEVRLELEEVS